MLAGTAGSLGLTRHPQQGGSALKTKCTLQQAQRYRGTQIYKRFCSFSIFLQSKQPQSLPKFSMQP